MKTCFIPWADLAFEQLQAWQRTAFFMLGCIEREQLLAFNALGAFWFGEPGDRMPARSVATPAPAAPHVPHAPSSANDAAFHCARGSHRRVG